ncbi:MAG: carbohydrate ABC transporter permease [Spirochaetales bacterium]|nr:carbohydrate ABC transporter permease [Spirochaetales bacterium]
MNYKTKRTIRHIIQHGIIWAMIVVLILPFLWMFAFSFGHETDIKGGALLPSGGFSAQGYAQVFRQTPFLQWGNNSLLLALFMTAGNLVLGFFAAYSFSRFKFRGKDQLFYFVLATMIIPAQAIMIPTFITVNYFRLINTYAGVVLPFLASGYAIFFLRQFFYTIPPALVEAAMIDGATETQILTKIYFPLSLPVMAALGIIQFVHHWNTYYWPLLVLSSENLLTLPVALVRFKNEGIIEWVPTLAASVMATVPVMLLYLFTQKAFVEGFAQSGIKG